MKPRKSYTLNPVSGQALLSFQGRIHPEVEVPFFEEELVEKVNGGDNDNLLLHGDCLSACSYLKKNNIEVDLVYIDPPFASGANYAKDIFLRNGGANFNSSENSIGEEIMYGDIRKKEDYLNWLYERLLAIREILSEKGSIYVHLDWHIQHYVKILMDEVFGEENFRNEIIWTYNGKGLSQATQSFVPYNANILFYTKTNEYFLDNRKNGVSKSVLKRWGKYLNENNQITFKSLKDNNEKSEYNKAFKSFVSNNGKEPNDDDIAVDYSNGILIKNIWDDIPIVRSNNVYSEYVNYSTQKPEKLLERIIEASTKDNMVVADFFSGSGVAATVAHKMNRKFITSDVGINSIQTTRDRLFDIGASFNIKKIKDGIKLFRNPTQTKKKIFELIPNFKTSTEVGIPFFDGVIPNENGDLIPIKIIGLETVGLNKKLDRAALDLILNEVLTMNIDNSYDEIRIIYVHKDDNVNDDYIMKQKKVNLLIKLESLEGFLNNKTEYIYTDDNAIIFKQQIGEKTRVEIKKYFSPYLKSKIDEFNSKKKSDSKKVNLSENGLEMIESIQFDTTLESEVWNSEPELEDKAKPNDIVKGVYELECDKFKMKIRNIAGDEIVIDSDDI